MNARYAWALAGAVATLTVVPAVARAQQAAAADDPNDALIREGVELRRQGRDADALAVFRRVWEQQHAPRARAQMGLAQQALGDWLAADTSLHEALAAAADPWISHNQVALQQALTAVGRQLGTLEIAGGVAGAEVFVNGQRIGALPLREPVRMLAATVALEVRAPGYYPYSRDVAVLPAVLTRETARLSPRTSAGGGAGDTGPAPSGPAAAPGGLRVGLGIAGLGAGALFLAGGIAANVVRESAAAHWNDDSVCLAAGQTRGQVCGDSLSTANTAEALTIVGYAVGGALVVTGAILLLVGPRHDEAATRVACGSGPGTVGASCSVRF